MAWKTSDNFKTGTANDEIHDMVDELQKKVDFAQTVKTGLWESKGYIHLHCK